MKVMTLTRGVRLGVLATLGCALAVCGGAVRAQGQSPDQAPATAFGAGRMVRGTVTATTPDHLTVKTETGEIYQVAVTPNTQVRKGREPMKFGEVHAGDGVGAMGEVDRPNKTVHAMMLMVVTAEQLKKAREEMGKSYIAGKVTAIDSDTLKLTILRSDGVTQTIQVDEGTSFKRGGRGMQMALGGMGGSGGMGSGQPGGQGAGTSQGVVRGNGAGGGESITLADIKVGDMMGGQGALKNGVFIPTELNVADPAARGQRRRQGDGGTDTPAPPKVTPPTE